MRLKICKHGDGCGYCLLHDEYCPESPCQNEELIDYEPVKHGRWVQTEDGDWECTHCKEAVIICVCGKDTTRYKERCPNCGAKMQGGADE